MTCCAQAEKGDLLQTNLGGFGGPAATGGAGGGGGGAAPPAAAPVTKIKLKVVKKDKKVGARCMSAGSVCQLNLCVALLQLLQVLLLCKSGHTSGCSVACTHRF